MKKYTYLVVVLLLTFLETSVNAQEKEKPDPQFKEMYFENSELERVTSRMVDEEFVYLVIETENAIGEVVNMTVDEEDGDFIYKKTFMSVNYPISFKLKENVQKLKLIVYKDEIKKHRKIKEKTEKNKLKKEAKEAKEAKKEE